MPLRLHPLRSLSAVLLLTVLLGGMVGGVVHRVHHGTGQAHGVVNEAPLPDDCDHSQHDVAFEHQTLSFHAEQCVLCSRQVVSVGDAQALHDQRHTFADYSAFPELALSEAPVRYASIRGPPVAV